MKTTNFLWLITTSRPLLWLIHLSFFLLGAAQGPGFQVTSLRFWLLAFFTTVPFCLFIYAINDYYDLVSDNHNDRKGGVFGPKRQDRQKSDLLFWGYGAGIFTFLGWLLLNWRVAVLGLGLGLVLWAYSSPPIRLKARPVLDVVLGGAGYAWGLAWLGFVSSGGRGVPLTLPFLIPVIFGTFGHLGAAAIDEDPDRLQGITTSPVVFGSKQVLFFCIGLGILALISFWPRPFWTFVFGAETGLLLGMLKKSFRLHPLIQRISGEYGTYVLFTFIFIASLWRPEWLR